VEQNNEDVPVRLEKLMYYPPSKGYALILQEEGTDESAIKLPIIIGAFEAQAIALGMEKLNMPRPLTHDLFNKFIERVNYNIQKVVVTDLKDGTYYANIFMLDEFDEILKLDARPSDAIALALRVNAQIYVKRNILNEAGQKIEDKTLKVENRDEHYSEGNSNLDRLFDLQMKLQKAIDEENYELAAKIRDKIQELEDSETNFDEE